MNPAKAVFASVLMTVLLSCESPDNNRTEKAETVVASLKFDTSFVFMHNNDTCELLLTRQEVVGQNGVMEEKIVSRITRGADTVFRVSFNFNKIGEYTALDSGRSFLQLWNDWGGSGYGGVLLFVNTSRSEPFLDAVADITELSKWKYSEDGNSVLISQGLWNVGNPDSSDFESHFSEHRQALFLYDLSSSPRTEKPLGITVNKYELIDGGNSFEDIRKGEPQFDTLIDWEKFGIKKP